MDINDILNKLGLDFSNPETKRGAMEAIEAILDSRLPPEAFGKGSSNSSNADVEDIEVDPDLLQPSLKHQQPDLGDDIDIEDEEDLLSQIKRNDSDEINNAENSASDGFSDQSDATGSDDETDTETSKQIFDGQDQEELENTETGVSPNEDDKNSSLSTEDESAEDDESDEAGIIEKDSSENTNSVDIDNSETSEQESTDDAFDEEDLVDDTLKSLYDDENIKSKHEARKIKRERTLQAARKALIDAKSRKVSPALIQELEKAITALEELTEAIKKNLKDLSDDEFNLLVNRIFDAIDAVGDTSLTFTSDAERELRAQEIKNDLSSNQTQAELSAEDVAKIRAENQVIKARNQEANKFKPRERSSFKGFQEFLNSLYRAVALQVHTDEVQDDSWSAINRRHSGTSVLQPGKRIQELPNKKIPVIDFYFDCSGSWTAEDIDIGQKAVDKLADMEADGQIKINVYYFANEVFSDAASARAQGGTRAWNEIVKNIISTQATNVIIMTDSDMEDWWSGPQALSYTVPGYVWYLWRDGENAPRLPRDLKGRGGTQQFSFSHSDL